MRQLLVSTTAMTLVLAACGQGGDEAPSVKSTLAPETPTIVNEPTSAAGGDEETLALPAGVTLIERVDILPGQIGIPYAKYRLDNGLTVILHEDKSDPLVHVDVTYHVGSAREDIGKSGFAHFYEHMMFQGSENVADEEHFKIITESGGTLNGTTNTDRTNYFETVPSNQLEKMLWLEADRMGFFLDAVTQEKFEVQRETVKNERNQRYENRPYGLLGERVDEAMYPEGHPYSWQTIGYIDDLNRAELNDLKAFFLRWYGPNNAALTIGGDIDTAETLDWVVKYFAPIPRGPEVEDMPPQPVTLDADRYLSMEDNVAMPLVYMAWPTVHGRHPDEAPLDVLMSILGDGRTSLFYKNLVRDGLAVAAVANHPCSELHCQFTLYALPSPASGASLADLEAAMRASLVEFETRGVQPDDLARVKAGIVSGQIFGLESVSGKVSQLAFYETFTGNPNFTGEDIARYEAVTAEDVVRVYNEYLKDKPAVIMSIVPHTRLDDITAPDTYTHQPRTIPESTSISDDELDIRRATDTFDRSIQPPASDKNPSVTLPEIWQDDLDNGVTVLGAVNAETPTTALRIRIETGQRQETLDTLGLASLTASMLGEATQFSTNEELSNRLALLGSSVSISSGGRFTTITVRSLSDNLDETLAIAAERLMHPAFNEDDFTRLKNQTLQGIENSKKQAGFVASSVFSLQLNGADNASAYPSQGTLQTVQEITLDDVKTFYDTHYSAAAGSIIVVTDLPQSDVVNALSVFNDWGGDWTPPAFTPVLPDVAGGVIYLVDKPDAAQSEIRIGKRALPFDATGDYFRAGLMNYALGGAFNSRINLNLREDKGYTYGARSGFRGSDVSGSFVASSSVRADVTMESITEFLSEIDGYQTDGITDDELDFTKKSIGQRDARAYETPSQKLGLISGILTYDLPLSYIDEQKDILANITADEINALATDLLSTEDMVMVVVGDKATILEPLQTLGLPIIELNEDGEPIDDSPENGPGSAPETVPEDNMDEG